VLDPAKSPRAPLRLRAGFAALAGIEGFCIVLLASEGKRDLRVADLVRAACEHTGLSYTAMGRLVRVERHAATNQSQLFRRSPHIV
jgi:hypothetical protein